MNAKQRAAEAAVSFVRDGMIVGLGTGSTADLFIRALAAALTAGKLRGIRGVPTSRQSDRTASELGIPVAALAECPSPDVTIDGADEVDPQLDLIKGLGGALLREKIVAQNSRQLVIIVDSGKTVTRLGEHSPLPVEVAPFGHEVHQPFFRSLGCEPVLRPRQPERAGAFVAEPFITDNGNYIYDCRFPGGIPDPRIVEAKLKSRAGVVETGLFLEMAAVVITGSDSGVQTRQR